jgi:hypothetical protein
MSKLPRMPAVQPPWGTIQVSWQQVVERIEQNETAIAAIPYTVETADSDYDETATSGEKIVLADGTFTITLPSAVANNAKIIVKLVSAGTVTITGSETIDGAASVSISTLNDALTLISDGSAWQTI